MEDGNGFTSKFALGLAMFFAIALAFGS